MRIIFPKKNILHKLSRDFFRIIYDVIEKASQRKLTPLRYSNVFVTSAHFTALQWHSLLRSRPTAVVLSEVVDTILSTISKMADNSRSNKLQFLWMASLIKCQKSHNPLAQDITRRWLATASSSVEFNMAAEPEILITSLLLLSRRSKTEMEQQSKLYTHDLNRQKKTKMYA